MKQTPKSRINKLKLLVAGAAASASIAANAAVIVKTNNATALNVAGSWTNTVVPGPADVAQWDATVSDVLNTTNSLGAGMSWNGIKIVNPAGNIQINAGGILTNGASGVDMTAATVDVAFSNTVQILPGALQQWNVAPGRSLSTLAIPTKLGQPANNSGVLQVGTTGTVRLGGATAAIINDNQNNPWVTYGLNDWAALDGSGNVIAATYTDVTTALTAGVINNIVGDLPGGAGSAVDVSALRFNDSVFRTLNVANSATARTMTARGILVTANCGGGLIGGNSAASFIRPSRSTVANTSFNIIQNSPNDFTISANVGNASSSAAVRLVKSGPGNLILSHPGNGYSGNTEINGGTLTVAAGGSIPAGTVTVHNSGKLVLTASNTTLVASSVVVENGATNNVKINIANASQYVPAITFNAGARCQFNYNVGIAPSASTPALVTSNLNVSGAVSVDVFNSALTPGTYPLLKSTNTVTGSLAAFALGVTPPHVSCVLSNDTTTLYLMVLSNNGPIRWATGNGTWDLASTPNWVDQTSAATTFQQTAGLGDSVLFEDVVSGGSPITVTLNQTVSPLNTAISASKNYTISGSGNISGIGALTKSGTGSLTLSTANSYAGGTALNGGSTTFSALNNLGSSAISFGGGVLVYAGGNTADLSARTVTFASGDGTIDVGANNVTFVSPVGNSGAGGLRKSGSGILTLNGFNNYNGSTVVSNGTLALTSGSISNSIVITVNSSATFDVSALGGVALNGLVGQKLAGVGTVNGAVTLNAGAAISPATNGVYGTITNNGILTVSGGTLMMDVSSGSVDKIIVPAGNGLTLSSGTVQLNVSGTLPLGSYTLIEYPAGSLTGSASSLTLAGFSQAGAVATLNDATPGAIKLVVAASASDNITWSGTGTDWDLLGTQNWYLGVSTPWAFTNGDIVNFNDVGAANSSINLVASVSPSAINVSSDTTSYSFNDGTGLGGGKISGTATLTKSGLATLTVNSENDTAGKVVINGGTVQVYGNLGSGNISNRAELVFSQSAPHTVPGVISGNGNLTHIGAVALTFTADSPQFTGGVSIGSGATLQLGTGGTTGSFGTTAGITNEGTLILNRAATFSYANPVSGAGALTKSANGNVTLTASNGYAGVTTINAGKVINGTATAHAGNGPLTIATGATNDLNGFDYTVTRIFSGNTTAGRIVNNAGVTNVLTINYDGVGTADCDTIIADNDGTGGKIRLLKIGTGEQTFRNASSYSGGTIISEGSVQTRGADLAFGTGPIYLNGGRLHNFTATLSNPIQVLTNSELYSDGNCTMNGIITGSSNLLVTGAGTVASGQTISWGSGSSMAAYSGLFTCQVDATTFGRFWRWAMAANSTNGSSLAAWDLQGNFAMTALNSGYTIFLGALSGVAGTSVNGNNTTYFVGGRNESTLYSGNLFGTGSFVKIGSGTLTLDTLDQFSGSTVVSSGTLALTGGASPTNSSSIAIRSGALLDVSALSTTYDGVTFYTDALVLSGNATAQTLTGSGTLRGSVIANANSIINPGDTIGTLTIATNITLAGTLLMELNRTNSPATNDMLLANGTITAGGTLTVTNLGPALQGGDKFKLFATGISGFTATNLPVLTAPMYWTNRLAIDGTIAVVNPVNLSPTNVVAVVNGNNLELSWPADHTGWFLQAQTNSLGVGLNNNWVTIPGTDANNHYTNAVVPNQPAVFYRMYHP